MLLYEKIAYEDYLKNCKSEQLDILLQGRETSLKKFAKNQAVDENEVKRQVRLHAPQSPQVNYMEIKFLENHIYPILTNLFKNYSNDFLSYRDLCGADIICANNLRIIRSKEFDSVAKIENDSNDTIGRLKLQEVDEETGEFIESKLHYLHSFRADAVIRVGLFLIGYKFPICYMSFTPVDRKDKIESLRCSLNPKIEKNEVAELSRVYGCGNLPKNTISFLIASCNKFLLHYKYLITAVNINLGFSGMSMLGSGFVPFAFRPVSYSYNKNGFYTTRRNKNEVIRYTPNNMPPNILYVREIESSKGTDRIYCKLVNIKNDGCHLLESAIEHEISEIRTELEKIWNENTRYHGTELTNLRPSKGQCGVSSLHLARKLNNQGLSVLFCEGDVIFMKKPDTSIFNHCWVLLKDYGRRGKDVIIDLTADQNGYSQKIIFKTIDDLKKQQIKYEAKSEKNPIEIDVEHLITRLDYLEKELKETEYLANMEVT